MSKRLLNPQASTPDALLHKSSAFSYHIGEYSDPDRPWRTRIESETVSPTGIVH